MTRIKICCIQNVEEALMAVRYGASALGLVSAMPSGPGPIPEDRIASIAATVPPGVSTFLLTSLQDAASIIRQQRRLRTSTLQLVDEVSIEALKELRTGLPGIKLVQVIHVRNEESVKEAMTVGPHVDGILLDSGNPSLPVKVLGGTGKTHDWALSKEIVDRCGKPVFLAGGLRAENVREAIERVGPYAVDVCSGVRTGEGFLDEEKLSAFMKAVRSLDQTS